LSRENLISLATHDHPEGIKGAQAVAGAIYLAAGRRGHPGLHRRIRRRGLLRGRAPLPGRPGPRPCWPTRCAGWSRSSRG